MDQFCRKDRSEAGWACLASTIGAEGLPSAQVLDLLCILFRGVLLHLRALHHATWMLRVAGKTYQLGCCYTSFIAPVPIRQVSSRSSGSSSWDHLQLIHERKWPVGHLLRQICVSKMNVSNLGSPQTCAGHQSSSAIRGASGYMKYRVDRDQYISTSYTGILVLLKRSQYNRVRIAGYNGYRNTYTRWKASQTE